MIIFIITPLIALIRSITMSLPLVLPYDPAQTPKKMENRIHGTISPFAIELKILVGTKFVSVSVILAVATSTAAASVPIVTPTPGFTIRPRASPSPAEIRVNTIIQIKVTRPIFPAPFPSIPPIAAATDVITRHTTDI